MSVVSFSLSRGSTSCVSARHILSLLTGIYFLNFGNFLFLPIVALCIDCISTLNTVHTLTDTEFTSDFEQTSLWYLAVSLLFCRLNLALS